MKVNMNRCFRVYLLITTGIVVTSKVCTLSAFAGGGYSCLRLYDADKSANITFKKLMKFLKENEAHVKYIEENGINQGLSSENYAYKLISDVSKKSGDDPILFWAFIQPLFSLETSVKVFRRFISEKSDVNAIDRNGLTPLHRAASNGNLSAVLILIKHGADLNKRDNVGTTPLHSATQGKDSNIVEELIKNGAWVNAVDNNGSTPLHGAILARMTTAAHETGRKFRLETADTIKVLLENGASPDIFNGFGNSAVHLVLKYYTARSSPDDFSDKLKNFTTVLRCMINSNSLKRIDEDTLREVVKVLNENSDVPNCGEMLSLVDPILKEVINNSIEIVNHFLNDDTNMPLVLIPIVHSYLRE